MNKKLETATLAGGCFWCTEAIFKRLIGVKSVIPGYAGGVTENPSYEEVCNGNTGHAEAIQIEFNPQLIDFKKILNIFWYTHDPTTKNRQGNDVGPQYRSVIFYHNKKQKEVAEKSKAVLEKSGYYKDSIVTEINPCTFFYIAEDYHKNYFDRNKEAPYCNFIIIPKIQKLLKKFGENIKDEYK